METLSHGQHVSVSRSSLKEVEKRKILESFVENDEALGQLLDFISSHYIQPNKAAPGAIEERNLGLNPFQQS